MRIGSVVTNPGELRTQVTLKRRTVIVDPGGFEKEGLETIAVEWARWIGVHGSEAWAANSANALRAATVLIRYRPDIDETCLVNLEGLNYEIVSIDDIRQVHEYLELKVQLIRSG